jgi:hypothetical protein
MVAAMTRSTLALDLGMKISWAIRAPDGGVISSSDDIAERYKGSGMAFWLLRLWLDKIHRDAKDHGSQLDIVFIEGDARVFHKWLPHLQEFAERAGVPIRSAKAGAVKKHAANTGSASKEAVLAAIEAMGYQPGNEDEAMAIALLLLAERKTPATAQFSFSTSINGDRDRRRLDYENEIAELRRSCREDYEREAEALRRHDLGAEKHG